jgi:hypothetical protein
MFKWICLAVAVAALGAFGWMLNDMRLESKALSAKADKQLDFLNSHLPKLLAETEKAAATIDKQLPPLFKNSDDAALTLRTHLPVLLATTQTAADDVADLSGSFGQYKALMGAVHAAKRDAAVLSYGTSVLSHLSGPEAREARIGLLLAGASPALRAALPAGVWAASAQKDVQFLSLVSANKADMLNGLARTGSRAAWHIQVGKEAPVPLADWIKATHKESQELK